MPSAKKEAKTLDQLSTIALSRRSSPRPRVTLTLSRVRNIDLGGFCMKGQNDHCKFVVVYTGC